MLDINNDRLHLLCWGDTEQYLDGNRITYKDLRLFIDTYKVQINTSIELVVRKTMQKLVEEDCKKSVKFKSKMTSWEWTKFCIQNDIYADYLFITYKNNYYRTREKDNYIYIRRTTQEAVRKYYERNHKNSFTKKKTVSIKN